MQYIPVFLCGSLTEGGPIGLHWLSEVSLQPTHISLWIVRSPAKIANYFANLNLSTATSIGHMADQANQVPCPNRHAFVALLGWDWGMFGPTEHWHAPHPAVEEAYRLREAMFTAKGFEGDDAKPTYQDLERTYWEALRAYLVEVAFTQDEFAAEHIADAKIAIARATERTAAYLRLAHELHRRQLPE